MKLHKGIFIVSTIALICMETYLHLKDASIPVFLLASLPIFMVQAWSVNRLIKAEKFKFCKLAVASLTIILIVGGFWGFYTGMFFKSDALLIAFGMLFLDIVYLLSLFFNGYADYKIKKQSPDLWKDDIWSR